MIPDNESRDAAKLRCLKEDAALLRVNIGIATKRWHAILKRIRELEPTHSGLSPSESARNSRESCDLVVAELRAEHVAKGGK
mgnify:CR=1 FL=1